MIARSARTGPTCSGRRQSQWQATLVVADPHPEQVLIWLGIVGGERKLNGRYALGTDLNRFPLQRSNEESLGLVVNQNRDRIAPRRRNVEGSGQIEK